MAIEVADATDRRNRYESDGTKRSSASLRVKIEKEAHTGYFPIPLFPTLA